MIDDAAKRIQQQTPLRRLRILQCLQAAAPLAVGESVITAEVDADPEIQCELPTILADLRYLAAFGLIRTQEARLEGGPRILARLQIPGAAFLGGAGVQVAGVMRPEQALDEAARAVASPDVDVWLPPDEGGGLATTDADEQDRC